MSNVLTWRTAIDSGYEPRLYPYAADDVPMGQYEATLDFKIWAKRAYTLSCYFIEIATGSKFQLAGYWRHSDDVYGLLNGDLDFKDCPVETTYLITVSLNEKCRVVFDRAILIGG